MTNKAKRSAILYDVGDHVIISEAALEHYKYDQFLPGMVGKEAIITSRDGGIYRIDIDEHGFGWFDWDFEPAAIITDDEIYDVNLPEFLEVFL